MTNLQRAAIEALAAFSVGSAEWAGASAMIWALWPEVAAGMVNAAIAMRIG